MVDTISPRFRRSERRQRTDTVNERQGGFKQIWSSFAQVLASGKSLVRPVFERQQYAHQLISEAYCEPHDHIRLVRLTAALEAFAMPEKNAIKESLAHRCALAGGWSNTVLAHEIYSTIKNAYDIRSAIVHGRGATHEEISTAFFQLEKYLIDIIQGFSILYAGIENASAPKSVDKLQKELTRRIDAFFWSPDIALSDSMGFQLSSNL